MRMIIRSAAAIALAFTACTKDQPKTDPAKPVEAPDAAVAAAPPAPPPPPPAPVKKPVAELTYAELPRLDFNRKAAEAYFPFFWRTDENGNGKLDPAELAGIWNPNETFDRAAWVEGDAFTPKFADAFATILAGPDESGVALEAERKRRAKVREELAQGRPTLVESDFTTASAEEKAIVTHVMNAAKVVERLHARQSGTFNLINDVPENDPSSRALIFRNQGPHCEAPKTEKDPECRGLASASQRSGLYPSRIQADPGFCAKLEKEPNAKELMGHFSVVESNREGTGFVAIPYHQAYKEDVAEVAKELRAAAAAIKSKGEAPLKKYLLAAAQAFTDDDWEKADEAWAAMNAKNSKFYLRIAADEVYHEPCAWKAGFHVSFARINPDSLAWQKKLEPVKGEMEKALATLAGPPYKARKVAFHLPDFIDIILNAGDSRPAHGATIGQSLPNWGRVAEKGGRTVAMTNLYTDADSQAALRAQMASLFCKATMDGATTDPKPAVMSTVLHEAAHNLGPSHEYKVDGKVDDEVFGGPLASTLEELKAQTSALYFAEWLAEKKVITPDEANAAHVRDVAWGFGHVAQGMYTATGKPKNYSQLAAIQLGTLHEKGVLLWKAEEAPAAGGGDKGCIELDLGKWKPAVDELAKTALQIKSQGDKATAEKLKAAYVDGEGEWKMIRSVIAERWLRAPKASFVYSVKL